MLNEYTHLLNEVVAIAKYTGREILAIYEKNGELDYQLKADDSPITEADLLAHNIITNELKKLTPDIPILSEEDAKISFEIRSKWSRYWLVDPLDGTNEFINHSDEFSVNIALLAEHKPVLGVIYAPAHQTCYFGSKGHNAFKEDSNGDVSILKTKSTNDKATKKIAISRNISIDTIKPLLAQLDRYEISYYGASLKLCFIAEGLVDLYPRLGHNLEWDTAAGQIIVEQAGGIIVDLNMQPLRYNTNDSLYNPYFVAIGDPHYDWEKYINLLQET